MREKGKDKTAAERDIRLQSSLEKRMRRKRKKKGGKPRMTEEMRMSEWRREDYIEWSGGGG